LTTITKRAVFSENIPLKTCIPSASTRNLQLKQNNNKNNKTIFPVNPYMRVVLG
jgi:hypothetical protein